MRLVGHAGVKPACDRHPVGDARAAYLLRVKTREDEFDRFVRADRRGERLRQLVQFAKLAIKRADRRGALVGMRPGRVVADDRLQHRAQRLCPLGGAPCVLKRAAESEHRGADLGVLLRHDLAAPIAVDRRNRLVAPRTDERRGAIRGNPVGRVRRDRLQPARDIVVAHERSERIGRTFAKEVAEPRKKRAEPSGRERPRLAHRGWGRGTRERPLECAPRLVVWRHDEEVVARHVAGQDATSRARDLADGTDGRPRGVVRTGRDPDRRGRDPRHGKLAPLPGLGDRKALAVD